MVYSIANQIETTADAYLPAVYQALTQFSDFERSNDALAAEFVPLSTEKLDRNTKLMVFGLLAPTANVSGKLLDRSYSSVENPSADIVTSQTGTGTQVSAIGTAAKGAQAVSPKAHREAYDSCKKALEGMYGTATDNEVRMLMSLAYHETKYGSAWGPGVSGGGSFNMGAIHTDPSWKGATFGHKDTKPVDGKQGSVTYSTEFRKYPTAEAGWADLAAHVYKYRGREVVRQAAIEGNMDEFSSRLYDTGYYQSRGPTREARIANYQSGLTEGIAAANNVLGTMASPPETPVSWQKQGAGQAAEEKRRQNVLGPTGYNSTKIGQAYMVQQKAQIQATQAAIENMRATPPLKLLINPSSWSTAHEKILTDGERSRNGPIIQVWGASQPKISASGKVPGFFSMDTRNADGLGLTRHARNYSAGWQNFQSLYAIYRNNGRIFLDDPFGGSGAKNISLVGSVYIYYDNTLYVGSFDSLNVTETDTAPFTAEYQFEFTVRAMFLLDHPIDPTLSQGNLDYLRGGSLPGSNPQNG